MRDRVPTPGRENRVKIIRDDGTVIAGKLEYDDQATQQGSPYTKGNVLPDEVCDILGINRTTSEPKDAWLGVIYTVGKAILTIKVRNVNGTPVPNVKVGGLTNVIDSKTYTDSNGFLSLIIQEGTYTLSVPSMEGCIDATIPEKTIHIIAGKRTDVILQMVASGQTALTITSTTTIKLSGSAKNVDVFCVGGGGGGGQGSGAKANGGGGGGGYTNTGKAVSFTPYQSYQAVIGIGGLAAPTDGQSNGLSGGTTSLLGVSAAGGNGGESTQYSESAPGGNGGSGGGSAGVGGSDGSDGSGSSPGKGQGRTTRAFGESGGVLCAGGGGSISYADGAGTYGKGGHGGGRANSYTPTKGSDGVIMIRWEYK